MSHLTYRSSHGSHSTPHQHSIYNKSNKDPVILFSHCIKTKCTERCCIRSKGNTKKSAKYNSRHEDDAITKKIIHPFRFFPRFSYDSLT